MTGRAYTHDGKRITSILSPLSTQNLHHPTTVHICLPTMAPRYTGTSHVLTACAMVILRWCLTSYKLAEFQLQEFDAAIKCTTIHSETYIHNPQQQTIYTSLYVFGHTTRLHNHWNTRLTLESFDVFLMYSSSPLKPLTAASTFQVPVQFVKCTWHEPLLCYLIAPSRFAPPSLAPVKSCYQSIHSLRDRGFLGGFVCGVMTSTAGLAQKYVRYFRLYNSV
jgi:hypothetical protein